MAVKEGSIKKSGMLRRLLGHTALIVMSFVFVLPFVWMVTTSFQPDAEFSFQGHSPAFVPASEGAVDRLNGKYLQTFVIALRQEVTPQAAQAFEAQAQPCLKPGPTLMVLDLDVPGGDPESALKICRLLKTDLANVHKVCCVRTRATAAGAMIALACNDIVMTTDGTLGRCEPLAQCSALGKLTKPEDVQAALRNEFLESARLDGFSAALTTNMIAADSEVWEIREKSTRELQYVLAKDWQGRLTLPSGVAGDSLPSAEWELLRTVAPPGGLLTLGGQQAVDLGFARAAVEPSRMEAILKDVSQIQGQPIAVTDSRASEIVKLLAPPGLRAPLKMVGEMDPPDASRITGEGWFLLLAAPPPFVKEVRHVAYTPTTEHYSKALRRAPVLTYFRNSLVVCTLSVFGTVLSSSLIAYGFAILRWKGRDTIFFLMLATMMLPGQVTMVPVFQIWRELGLVDTFAPLVVPAFLGAPFFIFLFRQFFLTVPRDLIDAARMDGASELGIYARVAMPLSVPAIATVALFSFLGSWNDFLGPLLYLTSRENYTLSIGLAMLRDQNQGMYGQLMGVAALMIVPVIVLFFFAQKTFIQGIKTSGIKG
jgi:multiple sugar transport system permease protein